MEEVNLTAAENAYNSLVEMGGRPTQAVQYEPGQWDPTQCEEELWLAVHFSKQAAKFRGELEKWEAFREYQHFARSDAHTFKKYQDGLDGYWRRDRIDENLKPSLQFDSQRQTASEEWKEFFSNQYRRRRQKELDLSKALSHAGDARWIQMAKTDLETWDAWLLWIRSQLPAITSEYYGTRFMGSRDVTSSKPAANFSSRSVVLRRSERMLGTGQYHRFSKDCSIKKNSGISAKKRIEQRYVISQGKPRRSARIAQKQFGSTINTNTQRRVSWK